MEIPEGTLAVLANPDGKTTNMVEVANALATCVKKAFLGIARNEKVNVFVNRVRLGLNDATLDLEDAGQIRCFENQRKITISLHIQGHREKVGRLIHLLRQELGGELPLNLFIRKKPES